MGGEATVLVVGESSKVVTREIPSLSIADDLVEDDFSSLVLRHGAELCELLPCGGADEQFWLVTSRSDMYDCVGMCWVRSDELVVLLWVYERGVARGGGSRCRSACWMRLARSGQVHVGWHPDEALLGG